MTEYREQPLADVLSMASHEFAQPLMVARVCAKILAEPPPLGYSEHDKSEICEILVRNLTQLQSLVEDFRVFAHEPSVVDPDLGGREKELVAMAEVLQRAASDFVIAHPGCLIDLECERDLEFTADVARFRQVLSNLLANADKFGSHTSPIQLDARSDGERILLSVQNDGAGFPQEEADNIFGKATRLGRAALGHGWGLYVAKLIVEAHGGRIWAQSSPGQGATFFISVPSASIGAA